MHRDWKGPFNRRLQKSRSERGRRMANARWQRDRERRTALAKVMAELGEKDVSLLGILHKMAAELPPAPAAGAAQACDLIPFQAAVLISFNGDTA